MSSSRRTPRQRWLKTKGEFVEMTTLHGMRRAGDQSGTVSLLRRYIWGIFMAVGLGAIIVITLDQIEEYRKHPTSTKTTITYSKDPLLFPAVTICSLTRFYDYNKSVTTEDKELMEAYDLAELSFSEDVPFRVLKQELLSEIASGMDSSRQTALQKKYGKCHKNVTYLRNNNLRNESAVTISDLLHTLMYIQCKTQNENNQTSRVTGVKSMKKLFDSYGFDIKQSLLSCKFGNGRSRSCFTKDFTPVYSTKYGKCWTFNSAFSSKAAWYQTHGGIAGGLKLEINNPQEHFIAKRMQHSLMGTGLKITLHDRHEPPDADETGFFIGPGFHSFAQVEMTKEEYVRPPWGKCIHKHKKYSPYTKNAAEHDCYRNLSMHYCGCSPASYINKLEDEICSPVQLSECLYKVKWNSSAVANVTGSKYAEVFTEQWRKCTQPPACLVNKFKASISSVVWPSKPTLQIQHVAWNVSKADLMQNYLVVDIYFPELKYHHIVEVTLIYFTNLLSKFGGTMGLFLGASILTVMELVELCVFYLRRNAEDTEIVVSRWRNSSRGSSAALLPNSTSSTSISNP